MDIRTLHSNCLKQLRNLVKTDIRITYMNDKKFIVPCTISDIKISMVTYNEYVGKDSLVFNILISDLKKVKAPVTQFKSVEYNKVKYQVQTTEINGNFDNKISLICVLYKGNTNG